MNSRPGTIIRPVSVSPAALDWALRASSARVLHAFPRSCNLIDHQGRILSLVSSEIGDGPFNAVFPSLHFAIQEMVDTAAHLSIDIGCLRLGDLSVDLRSAPVWDPRPDWARLHAGSNLVRHRLWKWIDVTSVRSRLSGIEFAGLQASWQKRLNRSMLDAAMELAASLGSRDLRRTCVAARALVGLGDGLTPAGDDILVGGIYAARILHGARGAQALAGAIVQAARGRTTSLSAAWLLAAARGEASIRWHRFLAALLHGDRPGLETSTAAILATGHTSGAAAMQGFVSVLLPGPCEGPAIKVAESHPFAFSAGLASWWSGFSPRVD